MGNSQKAGQNSIQLQAEVVNFGMSEDDIRSIISIEQEKILKEVQLIAEETVRVRLKEYSEVLISKLVKYELLHAFADPAIQVLFRKTERVAICTDRKFDYDMLSELLVHRVSKDKDFLTKAAINKAVEVIEYISENSLYALTLLFAVLNVYPSTGNVKSGLEILNSLFGNLMQDYDFSNNNEWIENLDLVQVIKIIPFSKSDNFTDYIIMNFDGYFVDGIKINSSIYNEFVSELEQVGLPSDILVASDYLDDYCRIPVIEKSKISDISIWKMSDSGEKVFHKLTPVQIELLERIYDCYEKNISNMNIIKERFNEELKLYPNLSKLAEWWNFNIYNKQTISITAVGRILAQVNAKRLDDRIPDLEVK